jgi:hypothetical protein
MIKHLLIIIIASLFSASSWSQVQEAPLSVDKNDLPQAQFLTLRTFRGEALYGYIDGGADLYLEYGFVGVSVQEFVYNKGKFKTEVYRMINPDVAYGIFSVSRFTCKTRPTIASYTCQNKYQLQIVSGPYYINIINESGNDEDNTTSLMIGKKILGKINQPSCDLSQFFPGIPADSVRNESYLVKGRLGIINGTPDLEDYFKGMDHFTAVILKTPGKILISVRFETKESLINFCSEHRWEIDKLSGVAYKMSSGDEVKKLSDNHILIEIPAGK